MPRAEADLVAHWELRITTVESVCVMGTPSTQMKMLALIFLLAGACVVRFPEDQEQAPKPQVLRQSPRDSHYLEFKGKPTILITSGEHYGAVLNTDFDYDRYLQTLSADGLNYTRIFTGGYVERASSFGIQNNSLAPAKDRLITPWARSDKPGYINGGNRFDLDQWNPEYFTRLKDFVSKADERGIVVEVTLFSSTYQDTNWEYSPLHPKNNTNLTGTVDRLKLHTLDNGPLLAIQEKLVRKLVRELNAYDNVFFEVQNEPYADRPMTVAPVNPYLLDWKKSWMNRVDLADETSLEWQKRVAAFVGAQLRV
ncbi:MAG: cellulase family glycosylhydrolase [Acidobacteriota bacterium]